MLSGMTITCFAASYTVAFVLELVRLFLRARIQYVFLLIWGFAGWIAHSLYLSLLFRTEFTSELAPFSSWYDWCLLASWVVSSSYLVLLIRRSESAFGIFLLPMVLALIGISIPLRGIAPFSRTDAYSIWRTVHGMSLLLGTVSVTIGFAAGLMYLLQAFRLKKKISPRQGLRLPSLEWLQTTNRRSLILSTLMLAVGLLSGIILNVTRQTSGASSIAWSDPGIVSSGVLFLWLTAASIFELVYKPARQGRKIAYLTLASFGFLLLALMFVVNSKHGSRPNTGSQTSAPWNSRVSDPGEVT